jgi:hypothetical protein
VGVPPGPASAGAAIQVLQVAASVVGAILVQWAAAAAVDYVLRVRIKGAPAMVVPQWEGEVQAAASAEVAAQAQPERDLGVGAIPVQGQVLEEQHGGCCSVHHSAPTQSQTV